MYMYMNIKNECILHGISYDIFNYIHELIPNQNLSYFAY